MAQFSIELILVKQLASGLAIPTVVADASGSIVFINEPAERLLGVRFDELGDLLFSVVSLARTLKVNPEDALRVAGQRFRKRFAAAESSLRQQGKSFGDLSADEMLETWEKTK